MKDIVYHIEKSKQGNESSRRILYEHFFGYSLKIVFRFIYRFDKAQDVVTDGFVKFFQNLNQFKWRDGYDNEALVSGWLKRIMINTAIDELRRQKMIPEIGGVPEQCWEVASNNDNADTQLLYKDLILALKNLPPIYRSVFNLYVIDGYTHVEIAEILNIPVGTSKSTLSRARVMLQTRLNQLENTSYALSR